MKIQATQHQSFSQLLGAKPIVGGWGNRKLVGPFSAIQKRTYLTLPNLGLDRHALPNFTFQ